jgi:O-antigen/teichoic acid export membrane protein
VEVQLSIAGRAVRSALYLSLSSYAMQVIGFLTGVVLARKLAPEEFGIFGLAMALMLLFARVKLWGFNALILAETDPDDLQISTQFWLSTLLSASVLVLMVIARPVLGLVYHHTDRAPDIILGAILIAALSIFENEGIASTPETMLARELRYDLVSLTKIVSTLLGQLTSIALVYADVLTYWALIWGFAAKTISYCAGVWLFTPRRPGFMFSFERARALLRQGGFMFWGGVGSFLAFQYDDIAVGTFVNTATLGQYRRAYDLSLAPMSILGGALGVTAATYARVKDNRAALSEAVRFILDGVALIVLPAAVGLALIAPEFVALVYTEKWLPSVPMLRVLLLYSIVRPLNDSIGSLAPTLGRLKVQMRFGIVQSAMMLVFGTLFTLLWGANGAALSAGLTVVVGFYLLEHGLLRDTVEINYTQIFLAPALAVALAAGSVFLALRLFTPPERLALMLYKGSIFSLTYGLVMIIVARDKLFGLAARLYQATFGTGQQSQAGESGDESRGTQHVNGKPQNP